MFWGVMADGEFGYRVVEKKIGNFQQAVSALIS